LFWQSSEEEGDDERERRSQQLVEWKLRQSSRMNVVFFVREGVF
jgi:hypothetical protein